MREGELAGAWGALLLALLAGAAPAQAFGAGTVFICKQDRAASTGRDLGLDFVVRPQGPDFCLWEVCRPLTGAGAGRLEYHCHGQGHADCPLGMPQTTAGPFVYNEDLAVDLSAGTFQASASGTVGDIASGPFEARVSGRCVRAAADGEDARWAMRLVTVLLAGVQGHGYGPRQVVGDRRWAYQVTIVDGALPRGLAVGSNGVLAGTPLEAGVFRFVLRATELERSGDVDQRAYSLRVTPVVP